MGKVMTDQESARELANLIEADTRTICQQGGPIMLIGNYGQMKRELEPRGWRVTQFNDMGLGKAECEDAGND